MPGSSPRWPPRTGTWVLDLDGVVWLTGQAIPGGAEAVTRLRAAGNRVVFATNNSALTTDQLVERLARVDVTAGADDLASSAHAAANMIQPGATVLAVADPGVIEALEERGTTVVEEGPADAVVVGWTRRFDFDRLSAAARAVRGGARLIGTNDDPSHPTPHGLIPGGGALLAAVATAADAIPEVAGKPYQPMADLIVARATDVVAVVGDRSATDGLLARRLDVPFALVLSGVTSPGDPPSDPAPAVIAADLAAVVDQLADNNR